MACAVGLNAAAACAAMRAGIAGFGELRYHDNVGEPVIGAALPSLDSGLRRSERLVKLLAMALKDCLNSGSVKNTERLPLLVGLAEPGRPGGGADWANSIIHEVESELLVKFERNRS